MSETSKHRPLTVPYCQGNGIDIGSGGDPVVPNAIQVELNLAHYLEYRSGEIPANPIQWHDDSAALNLPFKDAVLDFVYSSHLLEDFFDWWPPLIEWVRVLKPGGYLVILIPDQERWQAALRRGQPPNCAHRHEGRVGELTTYCGRLGLQVIEDRLAIPEDPFDYTIAFIARKL